MYLCTICTCTCSCTLVVQTVVHSLQCWSVSLRNCWLPAGQSYCIQVVFIHNVSRYNSKYSLQCAGACRPLLLWLNDEFLHRNSSIYAATLHDTAQYRTILHNTPYTPRCTVNNTAADAAPSECCSTNPSQLHTATTPLTCTGPAYTQNQCFGSNAEEIHRNSWTLNFTSHCRSMKGALLSQIWLDWIKSQLYLWHCRLGCWTGRCAHCTVTGYCTVYSAHCIVHTVHSAQCTVTGHLSNTNTLHWTGATAQNSDLTRCPSNTCVEQEELLKTVAGQWYPSNTYTNTNTCLEQYIT